MIRINNKLVTNFYVLDTNIAYRETYQNDILKNAKCLIVNWASNDWSIQTMHLSSGYALNTYSGLDAGSIYNATAGTLLYQYSNSPSTLTITRILVMK